MTIPLNNAIVQNAVNYPAPTIALAMNLCKVPQEGLKAVPMQFNFVSNNCWLVDLSVGNPVPPLSQFCSVYIDAINCTQQALILLPDSGYQVPCAAGHGLLAPIITGLILPQFYVYVPTTNATDIVNIFALNQFIPEFSCP